MEDKVVEDLQIRIEDASIELDLKSAITKDDVHDIIERSNKHDYSRKDLIKELEEYFEIDEDYKEVRITMDKLFS